MSGPDNPYYGTCVECLQVKRVRGNLTLYQHNADVIMSAIIKSTVACRGSGSTAAEARGLSWNNRVDPPHWVAFDFGDAYPKASRVIPPG